MISGVIIPLLCLLPPSLSKHETCQADLVPNEKQTHSQMSNTLPSLVCLYLSPLCNSHFHVVDGVCTTDICTAFVYFEVTKCL